MSHNISNKIRFFSRYWYKHFMIPIYIKTLCISLIFLKHTFSVTKQLYLYVCHLVEEFRGRRTQVSDTRVCNSSQKEGSLLGVFRTLLSKFFII